MSHQLHANEPWRVNYHGNTADVDDSNGDLIAVVYPIEGEENLANAARIVACVNACAGMEDPSTEIARLKADKARLLNAVRVIRERTINEPSWQYTHSALADILNEIKP